MHVGSLMRRERTFAQSKDCQTQGVTGRGQCDFCEIAITGWNGGKAQCGLDKGT